LAAAYQVVDVVERDLFGIGLRKDVCEGKLVVVEIPVSVVVQVHHDVDMLRRD
jgi:hypothetical protein